MGFAAIQFFFSFLPFVNSCYRSSELFYLLYSIYNEKIIMIVITIQISMETKDRLMDIGKKCDTFEDIIRRLLDIYDGKRRLLRNNEKRRID